MSHILFLTPSYPDPVNPVSGVFIREHARAISLYHQLTVVHTTSTREKQLTIQPVEGDTFKAFRISYPITAFSKSNIIYQWKALYSIYNHLKTSNSPVDLIHSNIYTSSDLAYLLSRIDHLPVVHSEHSSAFPRKLVSRSKAAYYRFFMNRLSAILPVSHDLIQHMQGFRIQNYYHPIANTVDIDRFYPGASRQNARETKRILCVAMLYPIKGIPDLLNAYAQLTNDMRDCELWIVGDGPERQSLEALTKKMGLQESVVFWGIKSQEEIATMMRQVDLFTLTSLWENQPASVIEAMATGLPVVAPRLGGLPEVIHPYCGELFDPGNISDIVEKLLLVLNNSRRYPSIKISTYARHEFSHACIGQKFSEIYRQLLYDL